MRIRIDSTAINRWRLPSGVTEYRNMPPTTLMQACGDVAVAFRGDRGSQHARAHRRLRTHRRWRPLSGVSVDRNWEYVAEGETFEDGDSRLPGRPRIATLASGGFVRKMVLVAVVLQGDRGSQRPGQPSLPAHPDRGGRPPG
jgi:hypothetical protein